MKRLPPAQIIAEYLEARKAAGLAPQTIEYVNGWFMVYANMADRIRKPRYRGAQIIHMTGQLLARVQSKG